MIHVQIVQKLMTVQLNWNVSVVGYNIVTRYGKVAAI
jgi:hypothetical protein